mgnify:CR=1 FL=1
MIIDYLAQLDSRRKLLWSAFIWYAVMMGRHAAFIPEPWLKAIGIAMVVGLILVANAVPVGKTWRDLGLWPLLRCFLIPFCVSSFSTATSEVQMVAIFPRNLADNMIGGAAVAGFFVLSGVARLLKRRPA